jgi:hypothetical protein
MERPALKLELGKHEIRWTYGLQQDLQRIMPDPNVAQIMADPYIQDYFVRRALTDKAGFIKSDEELIPSDQVDLDPDQIIELLDWLAGHILYFFVSTAGKMSRRGVELKTSLPQLPPSTAGSETSA